MPSLRCFMINSLSSNLRAQCSIFSWSRVHHCGLPRAQIYKLNIIKVAFSDKQLVCVFSSTTFFGRLWAAFEASWEVYFVHNRLNFVLPRVPAAMRSDQEGMRYITARNMAFTVTENPRLIFKKRGILLKFSRVFRSQNPLFFCRFRASEFEYSFHYPIVFRLS